MAKYIFKVFDKDTGHLMDQVIVPVEHMLGTLEALNELGIVKGFILDDKEEDK